MSRCRGVSALVSTTIALLLAVVGSAVAARAGVFTGGSRPGDRHMDIALQVLPGGRRANWRIDVYGPCGGDVRLGRTVGTDAGNTPPDPPLRLAGGRFRLHRHVTNPTNGLVYTYTLTGAGGGGGFAGTFHYSEHQGSYGCDSHLLHWTARLTRSTFP